MLIILIRYDMWARSYYRLLKVPIVNWSQTHGGGYENQNIHCTKVRQTQSSSTIVPNFMMVYVYAYVIRTIIGLKQSFKDLGFCDPCSRLIFWIRKADKDHPHSMIRQCWPRQYSTGSSGYQQRCQVSVADFEGAWWWPCNRNLCSKSNTSLTFEFLWHCMFHLEVVQRCSLLNIFSSITRAYTRGGCFLHDSDMATWRWTSFKSRRI